jgi:acyl-CoA thioester hydrolase
MSSPVAAVTSRPLEMIMDVVVRPNERSGVDGSSMSTLVKWLELGRMELFRKQGISPRQLEDLGYFLVVIHVECDVIEPLVIAERFTLRTWESRLTPAKVEHSYEFRSRGRPVAVGKTVVACIDRDRVVQKLEETLLRVFAG